MTSIVRAERETYEELLSGVEAYGEFSPGLEYLPVFQSLATTRRPATVLDAGCCTGKVGLALAADGWNVTLADLTNEGLTEEARALRFHQACLWSDLSVIPTAPFDYVYCCDVLEHVPTALTMLAVHQMLRVTKVGLFIGVSLEADSFGAWAGRPLHHTVQPFTWWRDHLREVGEVWEARDLLSNALFFVRP